MSEFISTMAVSKESKEELTALFIQAAEMAKIENPSDIAEIFVDAVMNERERREEIIYEYIRKEDIKQRWAERKARRIPQ